MISGHLLRKLEKLDSLVEDDFREVLTDEEARARQSAGLVQDRVPVLIIIIINYLVQVLSPKTMTMIHDLL